MVGFSKKQKQQRNVNDPYYKELDNAGFSIERRENGKFGWNFRYAHSKTDFNTINEAFLDFLLLMVITVDAFSAEQCGHLFADKEHYRRAKYDELEF